MNAGMQIGQVAKRTGLDVRLIRHYEKIGLIPPPRRSERGYASAGYRIFTEDHVHRLEFIALCRLLDLPLREIGDLLRGVDEECCASARPRLRRLLGEKLHEVDRRITQLQGLRQQLESCFQGLGAERQQTAGCTPATSPITCAFGEAPRFVDPEEPATEMTNLDPPTVGNPKFNAINSSKKEMKKDVRGQLGKIRGQSRRGAQGDSETRAQDASEAGAGSREEGLCRKRRRLLRAFVQPHNMRPIEPE